MRLVVEVELGNEAMQTATEAGNAIARALEGQCAIPFEPLNEHEVGTVRDRNGNTVGKWEVQS